MWGGWFIDWFIASLNYSGPTAYLFVFAIQQCLKITSSSATNITRSLLWIDRLFIIPDFHWDEKIHDIAKTFLIMEDIDGEIILFHDSFVLRDASTISVLTTLFGANAAEVFPHHFWSLNSPNQDFSLILTS